MNMSAFCFVPAFAIFSAGVSVIAATHDAIDRGPLEAMTPISITIALALPALGEAEKLEQAIYTPGDPEFHQFLTAEQFAARFAPSDADIKKLVVSLGKYRLTAEKTTATTLKVTGTAVDLERAFSVALHIYEVAAHDNLPGYTFHAPLSKHIIPPEITLPIAAVLGLDNRPAARPLVRRAPASLRAAPFRGPSTTTTGNAPGFWTVTDFANYYDVEPLYNRGLTGQDRTLGIITLASFTPNDAFAYWKALGLSVDPYRLQVINIDGGPGAPSDASGSFETALDVEQSGGVAPGAKIIVYQAPNTNQAWLDAFAEAIDANVAESVSTSWGNWEWLQNLENAPVADPINGRTVGFAEAIHELLLRAAIQGQTLFAASGDGGAYDINDDLNCFPPYSPSAPNSCTATLTVDYPASDPLITAAGGTTLPGLQQYCVNTACNPPFDINIPHERIWAWDYFAGFCAAIGTPDLVACGAFPWGSGGGVSVAFSQPLYQLGLPGTQLSQPGQVFQGDGYYYPLPAKYAGRNVPDVSFNADPETGYALYYTSDVTGFGVQSYWGGTSFVGPQLNGVTALIGECLHQRIGLLNPSLYSLTLTGQPYGGQRPPLHAIAYGDNWFYYGSSGYNLGAGLGTLDVANFAEILHDLF